MKLKIAKMTPSRKIKLINSTKQKCEKGLNLTTCFGRVLVYLGKIVNMKNCLVGLMVLLGFALRAEEGMLIPSLLHAFESDMKALCSHAAPSAAVMNAAQSFII